MENLKAKTVKAVTYDLINKLSRHGINFVITVFLSRLLSPRDFGLVAMVNVVIMFATNMTDMGLGSALIQRKQNNDEHYGSVFFFNITVGTTLTVILFFAAEAIGRFYGQPEIKNLMQALSFLFIINSFCSVRLTWLRKQLRYSQITTASIISLFIGGATGITMAFYGFGVWSLVAQTIISALVNNICIYFLLEWKPKLIFRLSALRELWRYGFYMFMSRMLDTLFAQMDNLIIGKLFSPITLGFYDRAKSVNAMVSDYSTGGLMTVLFPTLSAVQDDAPRYQSIVHRSFHVINFTAFFLSGIFFLCAEDLIVIVFSEKWITVAEYYRIMVLAGFAYPLSVLLVNILWSKGNSKSYLRLGVQKKVALTLNFIIGFYFGIKQFLMGLLLISLFSLALNIYYAAKEMQVKQQWFYKVIWKYFLLAVILLTGLSYLNNLLMLKSHIVHLFVFSLSYAIPYFFIAKIFKLDGQLLLIQEIKKLKVVKQINSKLFKQK